MSLSSLAVKLTSSKLQSPNLPTNLHPSINSFRYGFSSKFSLTLKTSSSKTHLPFTASASNNGHADSTSDDNPTPSLKWVFSTNVEVHACPTESVFKKKRVLPEPISIEYGGFIFTGSVVGDVTISPGFKLNGVVYFPGLKEPLLSMNSLLNSSKIKLFVNHGGFLIIDRANGAFVAGRKDRGRGLYIFDMADPIPFF